MRNTLEREREIADLTQAPPGPGMMLDGEWYAGDVPEIVTGLERAGYTVVMLGPNEFSVTRAGLNLRTITFHPASTGKPAD